MSFVNIFYNRISASDQIRKTFSVFTDQSLFLSFFGSHQKADCLGGISIFRIILIFSIFAYRSNLVKLNRNIVRTGITFKNKTECLYNLER
jgi:hypothetical protein